MKASLAIRLIHTLRRPEIINRSAFDFLASANRATINWTVANPLINKMPHSQTILLQPENEYGKYGNIYATNFLKKSMVNHFSTQGILCEDENVVIGSGVLAIFDRVCEILAIKESGQEVLIVTPTFGMLYTNAVNRGLAVKLLETTREDDWQIKPAKLAESLQKNSNIRILLLNFPNNPTGKVMDEEQAIKIADVLKDYPDVIVVCDEILRDVILQDQVRPFSLAALPQMAERTVVIYSTAKAMPLAGVRFAFSYMPEHLAQIYKEITDTDVPPEFIQNLIAKSLEDSPKMHEYLAQNNEEYRQNITHILNQLNLLNQKLNQHFGEEGIDYVKDYIKDPEAGNVYLLDFSGLKGKLLKGGKTLETGLDVAKFLLEEADIGVVPGECFFLSPEDMTIRIPLSTPQKEISIGFEKIAQSMIENLKNPPNFSINTKTGGEIYR